MNLFGDRIFTPRLCLRRITEDDLELLVAWSQSPEAYGEYLSPEYMHMDQALHKFQSNAFWNDNEKLFIITLRTGETPVGTIHYWLSASTHKTAVMALKIALPHERSKGYGFEAQKYVIINLFQRSGIEKIEMYTDMNNRVQQQCLQKLGFELIESLSYTDQQIERIGHRYSLNREQYDKNPVYKYHDI